MTKATAAVPRRTRLPGKNNHNIYVRADGRHEIGWRDATGRQRWQTASGGLTAARAIRDERLAERGRGGQIATNPRLRLLEAGEAWFASREGTVRPSTLAGNRNHFETRLKPAFGNTRLDMVSADDVVQLLQRERKKGLSESTLHGTLNTLSQIFRFAARRLGWRGDNPVALLLKSERPKPSTAPRRKVFTQDQFVDLVRASPEPWRTLFLVTALSGGRLSEVLGLTWTDVLMDDLDAAAVSFEAQVDRHGVRQPLKTAESRRSIPIPRGLAVLLAAHRLRSPDVRPQAFVFATRTGRALSQRNVTRALRSRMTAAVTTTGAETFPALHEKHPDGTSVPVVRGSVPTFHSFRHTFVTRAVRAGDSIEDIAPLLGHKNSIVTRTVYLHDIKDAQREQTRRSKIAAEYASVLKLATSTAPG